jgi:hypothetical protein
MYGAGFPTLLFLILVVWGLKEEDLEWAEAGILAAVLLVSGAMVVLAGWATVLIAVPAVILDVWLLFKLDMLGARVR